MEETDDMRKKVKEEKLVKKDVQKKGTDVDIEKINGIVSRAKWEKQRQTENGKWDLYVWS